MNVSSGVGCALFGIALAGGMRAGAADFAVPALQPPDTQMLTLAAHGMGVQIYRCQPAKDDASHFAWTLSAPEATLADENGQPLGKHYAGPTWEASDGSTVVGDVVARDDGPNASAIPWLLLRAKSNGGHGRFSTITWIQRLHTVGGKAPAAGCNATAVGREVRVSYSADYNFYAPRLSASDMRISTRCVLKPAFS